MKNKDLIKNYQHQLAELQNQFWFNNLDMKEYCVRYDAIKKRINELENEARRNTIWQKIKIFTRKQKKKLSKIIT